MKVKKIVVIAMAILITFLLLFITLRKETIRVGFITDLSGSNSDLGVSARNGVIFAIDSLNNSGGISGHKIDLLIKDHKGSKDLCLTLTKELVASDVDVIIGPIVSGMAASVIKGTEGSHVIVLSPTVSTDSLTGIDDNFIRSTVPSSLQGVKLSQVSSTRGDKTAVVITDKKNASYTKGVLDGFAKGNINILMEVDYEDISEVLTVMDKVVSLAPDALVLITNGVDGGRILQQFGQLSSLPHIYGCSWIKASGIHKYGGKKAEGMIIIDSYSSVIFSDSEIKFRENYMSRFNIYPDSLAIDYYEITNLYAKGVLESKSIDGEDVKKTLLSMGEIQGMIENYTLDKYGDGIKDLSLFIVKDGKYELYEK